MRAIAIYSRIYSNATLHEAHTRYLQTARRDGWKGDFVSFHCVGVYRLCNSNNDGSLS
jgi:hypothetical protein